MTVRSFCTFFLLLTISLCLPLQAQDGDALMQKIQDTRTLILKTRGTDEYRDSIRKSVLAYEDTLDGHCKDVSLDFDSGRERILAPLEKDGAGRMTAGTWRETVPGTACNDKRSFNVEVDVTPKGLRFTPTFPGEAAGDPELQNDTLRNVDMDFQVLKISTRKSCHPQVLDTHAVGPASTPMPNGILSQWKESWDVRACGKVFTVPITFIPDDHGTSISVNVTGIKPL